MLLSSFCGLADPESRAARCPLGVLQPACIAHNDQLYRSDGPTWYSVPLLAVGRVISSDLTPWRFSLQGASLTPSRQIPVD